MYANIAVANINTAVNGIELSFDKKPPFEVLKDLKAAGFRWHNKKQVWYGRNTAANVRAVEKYVDLSASDLSFGITPDGTVDVRAIRKQRLGAAEIAQDGINKDGGEKDSASEPLLYAAVATMREANDVTHVWEKTINGRCVSKEQAEENVARFQQAHWSQIVSTDILSVPASEAPALDFSRLNASMRDWYLEHYPQDADMAATWENSNRAGNSFMDLFIALNSCQDAYGVLPEGADSIVREHLFAELAEALCCDYSIIYMQWIDGTQDGLMKLVGSPELSEAVEAAKYDLGFGHLGNGVTVWNRREEAHGDYKNVAHISADRVVTYYDKDLPESVKQRIQDFADRANPTISAAQNQPVFHVPSKVQEQKKDMPVPGADSAKKSACLADVYTSVGRGEILHDSTVEGSLWSPVSGRGYYSDINACIYCNTEAAYVVELENAMKRGKECKRYSIYANGEDIHMYLVNKCNIQTPKELYDFVRSGKELPAPGVLHTYEEKGVEVFSPFVSVKPLKELPEKWKKSDLVKAIMSGQVFSGVLDQRLTDDYAYDAAVNFGSGRKIDLAGQAFDLVEGCRDCYIRTDGVDENGVASVHFSYAGDMKTFLFDVNCDLAEGVRRREAAAQALAEHNAEVRSAVKQISPSDIDDTKIYVVHKVVEDSNTGELGIEADIVQGFVLSDRLGLDEITGIEEAVLVPDKLYPVANFFQRRDYAQEDDRIIDTGNWGQVASGKAIVELTREGVYLHLKTPDYENPRSFEAVKKECMQFISGTSRYLFGNEVDYSKSLRKLETEEARLNQPPASKQQASSLMDLIGFAELKKEFEKNHRHSHSFENYRDDDRDER